METTEVDITSAIEALELWNRKLAGRMERHPVHEVRMDSFIRYIENMQDIARLRRQQESPVRCNGPQLG
jgi:hypothetical protein